MNEELIDEDLINEVLVRQLNDYTLGRFKDRRLLKDFPEELGKRVIGQKEAVSCMINAVLRAEYGLARSGRPLESISLPDPPASARLNWPRPLPTRHLTGI